MRERPNLYDYAKVIGIFLVVLGHFTYALGYEFTPNGLWLLMHGITLFHMPLFFIISGILYKPYSLKDTIHKGWIQLMKPYFLINFMCLILIVFRDLALGSWDYKRIISEILGIFTFSDFIGKTLYAAPLWFCWALFLIKAFVAYTESFPKYVTLITIGVGILIMHLGNIIPLRIDCALIGYLFFVAGKYIQPLLDRVRIPSHKTRIGILIFSIVALTASAYFNLSLTANGRLSINKCECGPYPILFIVSGISGSLIVLLIASWLEQYKCRAVLTISNGSILILGFHWVLYLLIFKGWIDSNNIFYAVLISACVIFFNYLLILFFSNKYPSILGNRKV